MWIITEREREKKKRREKKKKGCSVDYYNSEGVSSDTLKGPGENTAGITGRRVDY